MIPTRHEAKCVFSLVVTITCLQLAGASVRSDPGESSTAPHQARYRTFYVDSENGQDSNDGLNVEKSWRSLERVNSAELRPGDTVRLKCGGLWRGSLHPASGDDVAPIIYTSFGDGAKPLILGSRPRSRPEDWVEVKQDIWATLPVEYRQGTQLLNLRHSEWRCYQEAGADVKLSQTQADSGTVVRVECTQAGRKSNHVQLWGPKVAVQKATCLQFTFRARSSIPFRLASLGILRSGAPWTRFASAVVGRDVTNEWQDFEAVLLVDTSSTEGNLHISLGGFLPKGAVFEFQPVNLHIVKLTVDDPFDADVGNIIFDHGKVCGWKKWSLDSLTIPYDYYYDRPSRRVFLKSKANPATRHASIECAIKRHVIDESDTQHVVYDGLAVMYGAAHGFGGGNTSHIVIRNCDLGYIGGGHQVTRPDGVPVRYGNAIEFWGAAHDNLVENCHIWQVYDAALTNQNKTATVRQENIVYRNNVIYNCEYSFEYWNRPETSVTRNIRFINNTCVNAGTVWSHAQRPNPNGSHLMFYTNTARTSGFEVKYNIFYQVSDWGSRYTGGWKPLPDMNHNLWFSDQGVMANWFGKKLKMFQDYQKTTGLDAQSIFADPQFVDPVNGDYRVGPGSPARKLRADGGPVGAASLYNSARELPVSTGAGAGMLLDDRNVVSGQEGPTEGKVLRDDGTYQNGGYWATPLPWLMVAVMREDPTRAARLFCDVVEDFQARKDINEWRNDSAARPCGVHDYCASAAMPLAGARRLRAHLATMGKQLSVPLAQRFDADEAWLKRQAKRVLRGSSRVGKGGVRIFTPDATGGYGAFWVRDWSYAIEGCPDVFSRAELHDGYLFLAAAQRADGCMPDRVAADGHGIYSPGGEKTPLSVNGSVDQSPFMVILCHQYWKLQDDLAPFRTTATALEKAMHFTPRNPANGLVCITDAERFRPYSFLDTVPLLGDQQFGSVLFWDACRKMAEMFDASGQGDRATTWRREAERVKTSLANLWDEKQGLFVAASEHWPQPSIWGSVFAVYVGVASPQQARRIARYCLDHEDLVVFHGQVRHLPKGTFWGQPEPHWITPVTAKGVE